MPGTRVPLFLAAGLLGRKPVSFLTWALVAALAWTPLVVLPIAYLGGAAGPLPLAVVFVLAYGTVTIGLRLRTPIGRAKVLATVSRLWRWEFWPAWLFYLPLVPVWVWLAVRYRSATVWTCVNPGIPAGGVVGESKADILRQLPATSVIPFDLLPADTAPSRMVPLRDMVARHGWDFPLILKPDAGQRGVGVKKILDWIEAEKYLHRNPGDVLVQPYHPGPGESGIFYYRLPGEGHGHIFSITDKVFPVLIGDGRSTIATLIWNHPRYRMQAQTFLGRHGAAADRVLASGERFPLAVAGNHCQGTLFRDGARHLTPALANAVDAAASAFPGFHAGRFDVRYTDEEALMRGEFAVVELNGATAEATNVYDPSWPLWRAYVTLARQWALLFRIGSINRELGAVAMPPLGLARLVRTYYRDRVVDPLAD